jgi:subtilisin family serine protease
MWNRRFKGFAAVASAVLSAATAANAQSFPDLRRDKNLAALDVSSEIADLVQEARRVAESKQAHSSTFSNLEWRSNLSKLSEAAVVEFPHPAGDAGLVVLPRLVLNSLQSGAQEPIGQAQPVYRTPHDGFAVALGTFTARVPRNEQEVLAARLTPLGYRVEQVGDELFRLIPTAPATDVQASLEAIQAKLGSRAWVDVDLLTDIESFAPPATTGIEPRDEYYFRQWNLRNIQARTAWGRGLSPIEGRIRIAIVDDGIDTRHPDLEGRMDPGFDTIVGQPIIPGQPQPVERLGLHGTAVAGVAAAAANNDIGVAGVAWSARIVPIRAMSSKVPGVKPGTAETPRVAEAIFKACELGADIINLSWGMDLESRPLLYAIERATKQGILVVCAAGNQASDVRQPARSPRCLTVGAVTKKGERWSYSNFDEDGIVDLMAPAGDINLKGDIVTTDVSGPAGYVADDYLATFGGTSAAAPLVAGAAAHVWSRFPILAVEDVTKVLLQSATHPPGVFGSNAKYGKGTLDLDQAVQLAQERANEILATADGRASARLEAVRWPRSKAWAFRTRVESFEPAGGLAVLGSNGEEPPWSSLLKEGSPFPASPTKVSGPIAAYEIPPGQLRTPDQLSAALGGELPLLTNLYRDSNNSLVYPSGSILTKALANQGDPLLAAADQLGLEVVAREPDGSLRLRLLPSSLPLDVFEAATKLRDTGLTEWIEPEMLTSTQVNPERLDPRGGPRNCR